MGFWPYFLHAQASIGGNTSPPTPFFPRSPSVSPTGTDTDTTRFCTARRLFDKLHQ